MIAGCSGAKEQLGLNKQAPDEFKVVKRAPLEMPPAYGLRPPKPGTPRPQEQSPEEQARQSVLGTQSSERKTNQSEGEMLLLQHAGTSIADPSIREKINAETIELSERNKPVAQKLLGIGGGKDKISASVVDAKAEAQRLKENKDAGLAPTEGETPSIED